MAYSLISISNREGERHRDSDGDSDSDSVRDAGREKTDLLDLGAFLFSCFGSFSK